MGDFLDRLRKIRQKADETKERLDREKAEEERRARQTRIQVDRAADEVEAHIEHSLKEFQSEFVEFRFDSSTRDGRNLRLYWDEPLLRPDGREDRTLHQLSFQVRRHHEYADVEVVVKAIVRNRERRRRSREEDVWEGDPARLLPFVEREILEFTKLYMSPEEGD